MERIPRSAMLAALCLAGLVIAAVATIPRARVAILSRRLHGASSPGDAAKIATELLRMDSEAARSAVADFASRSPLRAFDPRRRVLLLVDGSGGEIYIVDVAEDWRVAGPAPPDPELREAIRRALPAITSRTLKMGKPPIVWSGIIRMPDDAVTTGEGGRTGANFLLKVKDEDRYYRLNFPDPGGDVGMATYDASEAQVRRWRGSPWWPADWGRSATAGEAAKQGSDVSSRD